MQNKNSLRRAGCLVKANHFHSPTPHGFALLISSLAAMQVVKQEGVGEE